MGTTGRGLRLGGRSWPSCNFLLCKWGAGETSLRKQRPTGLSWEAGRGWRQDSGMPEALSRDGGKGTWLEDATVQAAETVSKAFAPKCEGQSVDPQNPCHVKWVWHSDSFQPGKAETDGALPERDG